MFKRNFIKLCNQRGVAPSAACRQVGIAPATFSCWTDESVPRQATLMRIADYFGVTVDDLLSKEEPLQKETTATTETLQLTDKEKQIILAYRSQPNMHESVCLLLGINTPSP